MSYLRSSAPVKAQIDMARRDLLQTLLLLFLAVLCLGSSALGDPLPTSVPAAQAPAAGMLPCGEFSSVWIQRTPSLEKLDQQLPFPMLGTRYTELGATLAGYSMTGVPLVASDGQKFWQAGRGDDVGLPLVVTFLVTGLGLSLDNSVRVFLIGICVTAFLSGGLAFSRLLAPNRLKWLAFIEFSLVMIQVIRHGDVYTVTFATVLGLIPWILYFRKRGTQTTRLLFFFFAGMAISAAELVRVSSGLTVLVFAFLILLLSSRTPLKQRVYLMAAILLGVALVKVSVIPLEQKRNAFLENHGESHAELVTRHVLWHSAYIGLGFLSNPYIPGYCDEVAIAKVKSIDPAVEFVSVKYESILKTAVIEFVRAHPKFVVTDIAAKFGIILLVLLVVINWGLRAALLYPKEIAVEVAFWVTIAFSALPIILTVPFQEYFFGTITLAVCYSLVSLNHAYVERKGELETGALSS